MSGLPGEGTHAPGEDGSDLTAAKATLLETL